MTIGRECRVVTRWIGDAPQDGDNAYEWFHDANPKLYKAFLAAEKEAIDAINKDKRKAAQDYLDIAQDRKSTLDEIFNVINDKDYAYTLLPEKVFKTAVFMGKVGSLKDPPMKWQDLFFPDIHGLPGD